MKTSNNITAIQVLKEQEWSVEQLNNAILDESIYSLYDSEIDMNINEEPVILKASEVAKKYPNLQVYFETEDWMHILVVPMGYKLLVFSYIWDTRMVVRTTELAERTWEFEEAMNDESLRADDNHHWLIPTETANSTIIYRINTTLMDKGFLPVKFTAQTNNKGGKDFYINGIEVCTTSTGRDAFARFDKKTGRYERLRSVYKTTRYTTWNRQNIQLVFGMYSSNLLSVDLQNDYPRLNQDYQGSVITGKEVKAKLNKLFKCF